MGIGSEHEVEDLPGKSIEIGVENRIGNIMGVMSSGEAGESICGVGDDGRDIDKRGVGSIGVGR